MKLGTLIGHYFAWHYGQAYKDIWRVWMNFIWFVFYFFSIEMLLHSLFQPWKRMGEEYPSGFAPVEILQVLVVNVLMRAVGFVVRAIVIVLGMSLVLVLSVVGAIVFAVWTIMPVFLIMLSSLGLSLLIFG